MTPCTAHWPFETHWPLEIHCTFETGQPAGSARSDERSDDAAMVKSSMWIDRALLSYAAAKGPCQTNACQHTDRDSDPCER